MQSDTNEHLKSVRYVPYTLGYVSKRADLLDSESSIVRSLQRETWEQH